MLINNDKITSFWHNEWSYIGFCCQNSYVGCWTSLMATQLDERRILNWVSFSWSWSQHWVRSLLKFLALFYWSSQSRCPLRNVKYQAGLIFTVQHQADHGLNLTTANAICSISVCGLTAVFECIQLGGKKFKMADREVSLMLSFSEQDKLYAE